MGRASERGADQKGSAETDDTFMYIHIHNCICVYIYIYVCACIRDFTHLGYEVSRTSATARIIFGARPGSQPALNLKGLLLTRAGTSRGIIPPSSSNLIGFNSASQFWEIYRLKRATRPPASRARIRTRVIVPSRELKLLSITRYLSRTGIQFSIFFSARTSTYARRDVGKERFTVDVNVIFLFKKKYNYTFI